MTEDRRQQPDTPLEGGRRKGDLEARAIAKIKAVMERRHLSCEAVALLADLNYGTMWGMLHGRNFRVSSLDKVMRALEIQLSDLAA